MKIKLDDGRRPRVPRVQPGRPQASPLLRMAGGVTDIYIVDVESGALQNITKDADGRLRANVLARRQAHRLHGAGGRQRQARSASCSPTARASSLPSAATTTRRAKFYDDHTLVFTSTAIDPAAPVPPEVARNASVPNVWTLDLNTNQLQQLTDTMTGNVSPVVLAPGRGASRRVRVLLQGRERHSRHRRREARGDRGLGRLRRSGTGLRIHGAPQPHAHPREHPQERGAGRA